MRTVQLTSETDFEGWRRAARSLCSQRVPPEQIIWTVGNGDGDLFAECGNASEQTVDLAEGGEPVMATRPFLQAARSAVCHRDPERFARLYRVLFRMQSEKHLLDAAADDDVLWLRHIGKAISRDIHKTHAFVRFRKVGEHDDREQFAAWFEPEHRTLELSAPFFMRRFPNMDWAILSPEMSALWDGKSLLIGPGRAKSDVPSEDAVEDQWRVYFSSIFNPARVKKNAMMSEMPKKYWKNLPESNLIPGMLNAAAKRERSMASARPTQPNLLAEKELVAPRQGPSVPNRIDDLASLKASLEACRRCELHACATQAVPGEGPQTAEIMIVGEQPGDSEDLAGRPFVGPAGKLLDSALAEAGIIRDTSYVTNAVKHFKFVQKGKRRIHAKPNVGEITACNWWLRQEAALIKPKVTIALGASAARAVLGQTVKIGDARGSVLDMKPDGKALVTVHPSYLLRLPDAATRLNEEARFIDDLKLAANLIG